MKKKVNVNKMLMHISFIIYLIILVWIIGFKFNAQWLPEIGAYFRAMPLMDRVGKNIIPFYDMYENGIYFSADYFMNVIIYIPLGIYLLFVGRNKSKYIISFMIVAISSVLFELIQLVTGFGGCDGSDFVCNVIGGLIGILLYCLVLKKLSLKVINIINVIVIIIFFPLACYAFINTILNLHLYKIY